MTAKAERTVTTPLVSSFEMFGPPTSQAAVTGTRIQITNHHGTNAIKPRVCADICSASAKLDQNLGAATILVPICYFEVFYNPANLSKVLIVERVSNFFSLKLNIQIGKL